MVHEKLEAAILTVLQPKQPDGLTIWALADRVNASLTSVATCVLDMARRGILKVDDNGPDSIIVKINEQ